MLVHYHPRFARQYAKLAEAAVEDDVLMEVFGEVSALLRALEDFGHDIEGDRPDDASHPVVSSRYELYTLRRTPPTRFTPYASDRPVMRIAYVWGKEADGSEAAVVMLMGDKSDLGNTWYEGTVRQIEESMISEWEHRHPQLRIQLRRP